MCWQYIGECEIDMLTEPRISHPYKEESNVRHMGVTGELKSGPLMPNAFPRTVTRDKALRMALPLGLSSLIVLVIGGNIDGVDKDPEELTGRCEVAAHTRRLLYALVSP